MHYLQGNPVSCYACAGFSPSLLNPGPFAKKTLGVSIICILYPERLEVRTEMAYRPAHLQHEMIEEDMGLHAGPRPGDPMPDFELPSTDGGIIRKSDYIGRIPMLMVMNSITCPMTATSSPVLRRLWNEYGDRIAFVSLYVRDAHPGENFPQAKTSKQKMHHARQLKERDDIHWPVAVDSLNGTLHQELDSKSNAAYIMDTQGNVVFRSLFANDERVLRHALEEVLAHPTQTIGESEPKVVPMLSGLGVAYEVLDHAGEQAKQEFREEMPQAYVLARAASIFKPLPPFWRSVATIASAVVALGGLAAGVVVVARKARR